MNIAFQLFQLQEIDSELDTIKKRIIEIDKILSSDAILLQGESSLEEAKNKYIHDSNEFNSINDDIQKKKIKISQSESTLYSGTVKNPKELEDLQMEISSLKKAISNLDDSLLAALIQMEESEKDFTDNKDALRDTKSNLATRNSQLQAEKNNLDQKCSGLLKKKNSLLPQIDNANLNQYESLRKKKRGIAVTKLFDGSCAACGASLTASQQQEVRSTSKLFICPSCGRILYGSS